MPYQSQIKAVLPHYQDMQHLLALWDDLEKPQLLDTIKTTLISQLLANLSASIVYEFRHFLTSKGVNVMEVDDDGNPLPALACLAKLPLPQDRDALLLHVSDSRCPSSASTRQPVINITINDASGTSYLSGTKPGKPSDITSKFNSNDQKFSGPIEQPFPRF